MTNETMQTTPEHKPTPFGTRLKSAREALGLERKDAAAQLRLNENIIVMLEKDHYPSDLPVTFIRGYIRAYGKLLQIPESEIKRAIEPIQPTVVAPTEFLTIKQPIPVTSGNYFMQVFTYLIVFTMLGLVGMWWYTHPTSTATNPLDGQMTADETIAPPATPASTSPANSAAATVSSPASAPTAPVVNATPAPALHVEQQPEAPKAPVATSTPSTEATPGTEAAPATTTADATAATQAATNPHAAATHAKSKHAAADDDDEEDEESDAHTGRHQFESNDTNIIEEE